MNKTILTTAITLAATVAAADVTLKGIFSDDMVLQRGKPIPVSGTADPGEAVTVSYAGKTAKATAGTDGLFRAVLPALDVEKTGRDLTVVGKNTITLKNVVVGDVWMVSGQSNSEMSFSWVVVNRDEEARRSKDFPNIRVTKFRHELSAFESTYSTCNAPWVVADPDTIANVTAMGYFFARDINERTGVPIGLLDDNWSGCQIEPFISASGLRLTKGFEAAYDQVVTSRKALVDWCRSVVTFTDGVSSVAPGPVPPEPAYTRQYNAMVAPIVRFPIAGALWYQGCSNGGEGMSYADKLVALVSGWRAEWGYDFPFYIVSLASFSEKTTDPAGGNGFAKIRNAMRIAVQKMIPKTGLAVTIDIGNANDIHPKNKQDVGTRLARWARRDVYGEKDLVVSGPLFREMKIEGGKARLFFDHVGGGLVLAEKDPDKPGLPDFTTGPDARLKGFAVAGADRKWHWADAVIDGAEVVVSSPDVPEPVAVRYAFRANPMGDCNLYNKEGLPASPFRTDAW